MEKALKIAVLNNKGKEIEKISLDEVVFDGKVSNGLMNQVVVAYLSNQRKGLASTKTRGEVSGGGRKPWRQKGTGRARAGSIRSPLWYKGGITFGPKPHSFYKDVPRRMKIMALKSALNAKLKDEEIVIIDNLAVASHKTKEFCAIASGLKLSDKKARFVVDNLDNNLKLSSRNIPGVNLSIAKDLNTYEALNCKKLIFTKPAILELQERIKKWLM